MLEKSIDCKHVTVLFHQNEGFKCESRFTDIEQNIAPTAHPHISIQCWCDGER